VETAAKKAAKKTGGDLFSERHRLPQALAVPRLVQLETWLAIDNNASENALRRVAIGRKNWMFCGSDNDGRTAATLFSLIASCQRHEVEPMAYLRDVLTRIAATPITELADLLPDRWPAATAN